MKQKMIELLSIIGGCIILGTVGDLTAMIDSTSDTESAQLIYRAHTVSEEFDQVINLAKSLSFFKSNGYVIAFPQHPSFTAITQNPELIEQSDLNALKQTFSEQIYSANDYNQEIVDISRTKAFVTRAIAKLALLKNNVKPK